MAAGAKGETHSRSILRLNSSFMPLMLSTSLSGLKRRRRLYPIRMSFLRRVSRKTARFQSGVCHGTWR